MHTLSDLLENFFTHKDFLPGADQIIGTMFTPLHLIFAALVAALVAGLCVFFVKKGEKALKSAYIVIWIATLVLEVAKIWWETTSGKAIRFEWFGMLPLYPCSIFMYAMPFAIWGKGLVRKAACGYMCTLGLLGGTINYVYPATILGAYSCISFAGFHTFFYHSALLFTGATMLASGYHSFRNIRKWWELLLPAIPCLAVSVVANLVNFSSIGSDYMFFRLNSFFFAPIGAATPDWLGVLIVYCLYLLIHAIPYLPSYLKNRRKVLLKQA